MKLSVKIFCITIFIFSLLSGSGPASAMTIKCVLPTNAAYQYKGDSTVYFVTKNCTKQIFSGPTAFLQRIGSWKKIKIVSKTAISKIAKDKNYIIYALSKNNRVPVSNIPTPTESITLSTKNIPSNVPKKFLTIMAVNSAAEAKYEDNSWERTLKFKENDDIQIFEVAIWNNGQSTNPSKISLYKFDRTFDPFKTEYIDGGSVWVQYRERFNILNINIPKSCKTAQGSDYYACSNAYLDAFKLIFKTIVANQPAEYYGIKYLGHGSSGGLFENTLSENDSQLLLSYTNSAIGKKLDFLDWSTNCTMGTYSVLSVQYPYSDYILSSDLSRGGFVIDWVNDYYRLKSEIIFDHFFSPSKTIRQSLIDMVNSERKLWETSTVKNDMIARQIKQSLSIYDSSKFGNLISVINLNRGAFSGDVLDYIRKNYPTQEQHFYDLRFHYINNKDFFSWDVDSNGFKF